MDCLIYLHEKGCPWNEICCEYATLNGYLEIEIFDISVKMDVLGMNTCASQKKYIKVLKYLHENGCVDMEII